MLGGLNHPNQYDAAGGDGAVGESVDEVADKGDLVRDADAAGEHHDSAVGVQNVGAAVGAFNEGFDSDRAVEVLLGFFEELIREAGAAADNEGHSSAVVGEDVLAGQGDTLLRVKVLFRVAPSDGEWVGGPEADGRNGQENMLAWYEGPWAGNSESETDGIAWESLELGFGASISKVAVKNKKHANETLSKVSESKLRPRTVNVLQPPRQ